MTDKQLIDAFKRDPSIPYELSDEDLQRLLALVGEYEPVIDAINQRAGASLEERAEAIGCSASDFWYETR